MSKDDLFDSVRPAFYCIDCSVISCWKEGDRFLYIGSTFSHEATVCHRKKRLYSWDEVNKEKTAIITGENYE